jgi:hypothetical protein
MGVGFSQHMDHVEYEHLPCREPAAQQPVQIVQFHPVGGEVADPFLAVTTERG